MRLRVMAAPIAMLRSPAPPLTSAVVPCPSNSVRAGPPPAENLRKKPSCVLGSPASARGLMRRRTAMVETTKLPDEAFMASSSGCPPQRLPEAGVPDSRNHLVLLHGPLLPGGRLAA